MEKKGESQRGGIKEIENEDYAHKILFAAGTAILMACLKRAILVSFAAQWRWWVFVVLNLVLLAIVFMSTSSTERENQEINTNVDKKKQRKQRRKQCRLAEAEVDRSECCYEKALSNNVVQSIGTVEDNGDELPNLSKEELNERVEAFIVMFKKHLASDAKNGRGDFFFLCLNPSRVTLLLKAAYASLVQKAWQQKELVQKKSMMNDNLFVEI